MNIKQDFPLLKERTITYLDSGATTQKPQYVIEKIEEYYKKYNANIHRGAYTLSEEATEIYEETRKKIANFINAKSSEEIIYTKNATESLNLVAYSYGMNNLKENDEICISIMEHHSNLVPWQKVAKVTGAKLKYMYINENYEISDEEIEKKITNKTKIVGITHVSNVLGTINNIEKIIKQAHKKRSKSNSRCITKHTAHENRCTKTRCRLPGIFSTQNVSANGIRHIIRKKRNTK